MNPKQENSEQIAEMEEQFITCTSDHLHTSNVKEETETDTNVVVKQEVEGLLNDSKVLVKAEPSWDIQVSSDSPSIIIGIAKIEKEMYVKSEAIDIEYFGSKKGPQHVKIEKEIHVESEAIDNEHIGSKKGRRQVKIEKSSEESRTRNLRTVKSKVPHLKERGPSKKTLQRPSRKTLQCKVCNKKYKTKHLLQMHELLHSDTKPFQCDQCPQAFYRKSCLKVHKTIHTGEKPFECNICHERLTHWKPIQMYLLRFVIRQEMRPKETLDYSHW